MSRRTAAFVVAAIILVAATVLAVFALPSDNGSDSEQQTDVPRAPNIALQSFVPLAPGEKAVDKIEGVNKETRNKWYIATVHKADVYTSEKELYEMRKAICKKVDSGASLTNILTVFDGKGYTDDQKGKIIASAMLSKCPNGQLKINKQYVQDMEDKDKK